MTWRLEKQTTADLFLIYILVNASLIGKGINVWQFFTNLPANLRVLYVIYLGNISF